MGFAEELSDLLPEKKREGLSGRRIAEQIPVDSGFLTLLKQNKRAIPPHTFIEKLAQVCAVPPERFTTYREMGRLAHEYSGGDEPTNLEWETARMRVRAAEERVRLAE